MLPSDPSVYRAAGWTRRTRTESILLMRSFLPLHSHFEQSVSYLQLILRIGRWECACVGLFIVLATFADSRLRSQTTLICQLRFSHCWAVCQKIVNSNTEPSGHSTVAKSAN